MNNYFSLDFSTFQPDNCLWPKFVERFGLENSQKAVRQAFDLQRMHGTKKTIPVLFSETCGIALTSIDLLKEQSGYVTCSHKMLLLLSKCTKSLQILKET